MGAYLIAFVAVVAAFAFLGWLMDYSPKERRQQREDEEFDRRLDAYNREHKIGKYREH